MAFPFTSNSSFARWLRQRASRFVSPSAPVVLGGAQRSGTTLLRVMLDSHPHIALGPECSLLAGGFLPQKLARRFDMPVDEVWRLRKAARDHAQFVELFFARYAQQRGKPRWGEKTPQNVRHIAWILAHWPKARFIHVVRDGRDAVCSSRTHPRFRLIDGERIPTGIQRPLQPCIESWLRDTAAGMHWRGHPQYCEVRYEDLVTETEATLRKVCEFIREAFDPVMLNYHAEAGSSRDADNFVSNVAATKPLKASAIGRWRQELSAAELQLFQTLAATRMAELGYSWHSHD